MKLLICQIFFAVVFILHESHGKDEERDMHMPEPNWMSVDEHMIKYAVIHKKADYKKAAYYCMHYGGKLLAVPHAMKVMKYIHDYLYHMSHDHHEHGRSDNVQSRKMMMGMHKYYHKLRIDAMQSWTDSMGYPAPVMEEFGYMYSKHMASLALCPSIMRVKMAHPKAKLYFVCEKDMYDGGMMMDSTMPYETTQMGCSTASLMATDEPNKKRATCPRRQVIGGFVNTVSKSDFDILCCPIEDVAFFVNRGGSGTIQNFKSCLDNTFRYVDSVMGDLSGNCFKLVNSVTNIPAIRENCYRKHAPFGTDLQCDDITERVFEFCMDGSCDPTNSYPGSDVFIGCCTFTV